MAHAKLSPSASPRWLRCPGSVRLSEGYVDAGNKYTEEGTTGHELARTCLTGGPDLQGPQPTSLVGMVIPSTGWEVDEEMAGAVQVYTDYVRALPPGITWVEEQVDLTTWIPDGFGTVDMGRCIVEVGELHVVDYKHGRGVLVSPEENEQLMCYGLGLLEVAEMIGPVSTVHLHIVQPRAGDGEPKVWTTTAEELHRWGDEVLRPGAELALSPDAPVVPGEKQCRWCPVRGGCAAYAVFMAGVIGGRFSELVVFEDIRENVLPDPELLTPEQLAAVLPHLDALQRWASEVQSFAAEQIMGGATIPGWKVVAGRAGPRKWVDGAIVEVILRDTYRLNKDQMYDHKLISPTTAEKLAKAGTIGPQQWKDMQAHITRTQGGPALAPESDRRKALTVQFEAIENGDQ